MLRVVAGWSFGGICRVAAGNPSVPGRDSGASGVSFPPHPAAPAVRRAGRRRAGARADGPHRTGGPSRGERMTDRGARGGEGWTDRGARGGERLADRGAHTTLARA